MRIEIMNPGLASYEIFPRVARLGVPTHFKARGLGIDVAFIPNHAYEIKVIPQEEITTQHTHNLGIYTLYETLEVMTDDEGVLAFDYTCRKEQIYLFRIKAKDDERKWENGVNIRVFGAADDLWSRIPMRGNTHCHACPSVDAYEDPVVAAAVYRKVGFDYVAITDHSKTDGSVIAKKEIESLPTEMQVYYGEEVHVPNPYIHAVNVGALLEGGIGLSVYYHEHKEEVIAAVKKIAEEAVLPDDLDPMDYGWRKWIADTIHANGGLAIVAHPFWNYDAHNTPNAMLHYIAETKLFDAMEVIHGQDPDSDESNLEIAYWHDLRAEGINFPIVGCDDAHRRSFAWNYDSSFNDAYTVIFAKDPSFEGFSEAVRSGYTAAVENFRGAPNHVTGTYRMTKFTFFLLNHYYPLHDQLCFEEGCMIKDAYLGDKDALEQLKRINGRVKKFTDRFFGRNGD